MAKKKELTPKEKKIKEEQLDMLSGCVQVEAHAECMKKGCKSYEFGYDEFDTAQTMYEKGWVYTRNILYCPNCAKKYLKKK